MIRRTFLAVSAVLVTVLAAGCQGSAYTHRNADQLQVVATTGIIADLVKNVAGDAANVVPLVPANADPHSYEPTLRDVRNIVYSDVAFSNYVMLEEHKLIKTLDANIPPDAPNIGLAEGATKYSARVIPLVEDVTLDTVWLGLRVSGAGSELGADRASEVRMKMTEVIAPSGGTVHGFLTQALGQNTLYFDSSDGAGDSDVATLPVNAHTHLSWAFSKPGVYKVTFETHLATDPEHETYIGKGTYTFAVGVDPHSDPQLKNKRIIDEGHADLTTDLDTKRLTVFADSEKETSSDLGESSYERNVAGHDSLNPDDTVISVTNKAWQEIPRGSKFLGEPGSSTYLLPQAVLGKHVHGEMDPHLWHDVSNAIAYVKLIRDTLSHADPDNARTYEANAKRYVDRLDALDREVRDTLASIPKDKRHLITTHDAFAYLGAAYDVDIAGFVTPNPAVEPSVTDRIRLADTIRNLKVPAVFVEPQLGRSLTLRTVADEANVSVCDIYSDAFDSRVTTYEELMRFNAQSLKGCLT